MNVFVLFESIWDGDTYIFDILGVFKFEEDAKNHLNKIVEEKKILLKKQIDGILFEREHSGALKYLSNCLKSMQDAYDRRTLGEVEAINIAINNGLIYTEDTEDIDNKKHYDLHDYKFTIEKCELK